MIAQIFSGCSLEQFSNIFPHVAIFTITMLCFSSILTSDSQFSVICYSIFLYNSLYWYCTAILKFLISQFSILNSQLLATAVFCFSISQIVILNSQLLNHFTAFSHLILVTGTVLHFSNIPDITAFFSYSSLAAMNLLSQIFLPCPYPKQ